MSADKDQTRSGCLIVLAAPSGAGKTTLVRALLGRKRSLQFSVSYTTRQPRPAEVDGKDYFFVSETRFRNMIEQDAFLEYARVFDHWYGTGREHVEVLRRRGEPVVLEIDWQGARQVRRRAPEALSIFILPPSVAELERRLRGRGTDSEATIRRRLGDALGDMTHWREFDFAVINEDVNEAAEQLEAIIDGHGSACRTDSPELEARVAGILRQEA